MIKFRYIPYYLLKPFVTAYYFIKFRPTVIGKENIPKKVQLYYVGIINMFMINIM